MPGPWGKAIEKLRLDKRLTRKTLAKRADMMPTTYGRIERGHHTQTKKLQDIADALEVPIEKVLLISPLKSSGQVVNNPRFALGDSTDADTAPVPNAASSTEELRELRAQVALLMRQIADIYGEKEARNRRRRRKRVPKTRVRKPGRPADVKKSR